MVASGSIRIEDALPHGDKAARDVCIQLLPTWAQQLQVAVRMV